MASFREAGTEKKKIGQLLVENGFVTADQVQRALEVQKTRRERICSILIDMGYLTEGDFLEFLGMIPGAASIELSACEIEREIIDLVSMELAQRLELVPIGKLGNSLTVAMVCPIDEAGREELEKVTGLKVRPVLCSRSAVYTALERYYKESQKDILEEGAGEDLSTLEGTMKLRRVAKLVEEIGEIPTLPSIVNLISEIVNDPNSSATDLAKVISTDVGLSTKILKLANSAAFGFSREISNIPHATPLLGFRQTQALALSVPIFENLINMAKFDFAAFWSHSLRCAKLSKLISLTLTGRGVESAFVAGLLHDMGKVVLAMSMRGRQEQVESLKTSAHLTPVEAEEEVLGITHAEVGYLLGEHWLLPHALTSAIRYHHSPELQPEAESLADVIFLANSFCKIDPSRLEQTATFDDKVLEILGKLAISEVVFQKTLESYSSMATSPDIQLF